MRNKPPYALSSVDNALRLVQLLRDQGRLRVVDAAAELDVAPSTAHRLLGMLVYRGFAIQDDDRAYLPGPALGAAPAQLDWTRQLRDAALPHLELLSNRTGETTNLMIRIGLQVRFLASVESPKIVRVGTRQGTVLPARLTSGGKALLAELKPDRLESLYQGSTAGLGDEVLTADQFQRLAAELILIKQQGYALNDQQTEESVVACGVVVLERTGGPTGAISVSMPADRYASAQLPTLVRALRLAAAGVERDITGLGVKRST
jgi:IclR family transcriptional regulator, acetate operon repressor